ncbi:MAG TPA: hypothetical protein VMS22_03265 [Candidatus Eisenbacteria bacterium]|nr:hypothetical protein [Candidatus Eisenbacteria bacterium]
MARTAAASTSFQSHRTAIGAPVDPETVGSWIEHETLLPQQFIRNARAACATPERRLMAAVLGDAIAVYMKYAGCRVGRNAWLFAEANRWFQSRDREWPFSFERICEAFDFEPSVIRRVLFDHAAKAVPSVRAKAPLELRRAPVVRRGSVRLRGRAAMSAD